MGNMVFWWEKSAGMMHNDCYNHLQMYCVKHLMVWTVKADFFMIRGKIGNMVFRWEKLGRNMHIDGNNHLQLFWVENLVIGNNGLIWMVWWYKSWHRTAWISTTIRNLIYRAWYSAVCA